MTNTADESLNNPRSSHGFSIPAVCTDDFVYDLPPERIAVYPVADRSASKLLVATINTASERIDAATVLDVAADGRLVEEFFNQQPASHQQCEIAHHIFADVVSLLPQSAMLVMNDSRVIAARIPMQKPTGGAAEVFCIAPLAADGVASRDPAVVMNARHSCVWQCMVGGRHIVEGMVLHLKRGGVSLYATVQQRSGMEAVVALTWSQEQTEAQDTILLSFAECLECCGEMPLPPYIKRSAEAGDKEHYQTVYAAHDGSVAAPTAGLHFTPEILSQLTAKGVTTQYVTLHVGAGTFKPMHTADAKDHTMHYERIVVGRETIRALAEQSQQRFDCIRTNGIPVNDNRHQIVAVGTTSTRTLESLYWFGVRLALNDGDGTQSAARHNKKYNKELVITQWDAYRLKTLARERGVTLPTPAVALTMLHTWMTENGMDILTGETQLMIVPGYDFAIVDALITNFHQPHSTLILLVAAFLAGGSGRSSWREVYDAALANEYRFLSYGDSSLLFRGQRDS